MDFFEDHVPTRARRYICTVIATALPVLLFCVYETVTGAEPSWILLAALTALANCFPLRISIISEQIWITFDDAFVFLALIHFGPEVAVVVAAIEAVAFNLRKPTQLPYRAVFTIAQLVIATFLAGHVLYRLLPNGLPLSLGGRVDSRLLVAALFGGALYFLMSSVMVSVAIANASQKPLLGIWKKILPGALVTLAGAALASTLLLQWELDVVNRILDMDPRF